MEIPAALLSVLKSTRACWPSQGSVVIPEPYLPYVPPSWNGVLLVSEAQNLGAQSEDYVARLRQLNTEQRYHRLYPEIIRTMRPDQPEYWGHRGVQPWDEGPLRLAVRAVWGKSDEEFAISNAVLWSTKTDTGANATPERAIEEASANLWTQMLPVLQPRVVVAVGAVAERVMKKAGIPDPVRWLSASPRVLAVLSKLGRREGLLGRFDEVRTALNAFDQPVDDSWVAYACHAVSATPDDRALMDEAHDRASIRDADCQTNRQESAE